MPAIIISGVSVENGVPHVIATDSHGRIIIADSEHDESGQSGCTVEVVENVGTVATVGAIVGLVGTKLGAIILGTDVRRAAVYTSNVGDNVLVPAVAGQCIRVLGLVLTASSTTEVQLESGLGGPVLMRVNLVKHDNFILPVTLPGYHWIETLEGDSLNLRLFPKEKVVSGCIVYYID